MSIQTNSTDMLYYLCVGKLNSNKKHLLLCYQHNILNKPPKSTLNLYKSHIHAIMDKAVTKLTCGKRIRLTSDNGYDLHVLRDNNNNQGGNNEHNQAENNNDDNQDNIIFFAITSNEFGKYHLVSNLLKDFRNQFYNICDNTLIQSTKSNGNLNKPCESVFKNLYTQYNTSLLADVTIKVEEVKSVMKNNIEQALETVDQLEDMEDKGKELEDRAKEFKKRATKVKSMMRSKYVKVSMILVIIIASILGYIIYEIYTHVK